MNDPDFRVTGWGGESTRKVLLDEIQQAAQVIQDVIVRTPLVQLQSYNQNHDILLKPEILQPIGSFKLRGVFNWAASLSDKQRNNGLSTISAGNTAQAIGYVAQFFNVLGRSIVPFNAPEIKIQAIRDYGTEVIPLKGKELWKYFFNSEWANEPYNFLNPWAEPKMIAGSATIGLEILEDLPGVDTIFVPIGGGGLVTGIGSALKALKSSARIVGVQSEANYALKASFDKGGPTWIESKSTICDGVLVPLIVDEMYPILRELIDEVKIVTEKEVKQAIKHLALRNKMIAEGAGALSVAGARSTPAEERGKTVCLVTGGSIQPDKLIEIIKSY